MLREREVFQKAFALVSNPETFGQGSEDTLQGRKYCTATAIGKVTDGAAVSTRLWGCICAAAGLPDNGIFTVWRWNDTHTHEEVVALWTNVGKENNWLDQDVLLDVGATAAEGA